MIHVVLFQPEIPPNTGNIIRTCMASNAQLHLIKPLGFRIDDAAFKRAGLDYLRSFKFSTYENYEDFVEKCHPENVYIITRFGNQCHSEINVSDPNKDYYFIFGSETHGLPERIHDIYHEYQVRIPMAAQARCLNLSNSVAIIVYEALRQQNYPNLSRKNVLEG